MTRERQPSDAGMSLLEVVLATSILAICMAMFSSGILQIYRSVNKSESTSTAQSLLNSSFSRLEKEIRYASGISTPGPIGLDSYVEYLTTSSGTAVCVELRLRVSTRQLQRRTWTQGASAATPRIWVPLAYNVSSAQPFTVLPADATFNFQRLRIQLTVSAGAGATTTSTQTDTTFTAQNTALGTPSPTVCVEGRAVP